MITQTMPETLVFCSQRSWQNPNRVTPNGGARCMWGRFKLATFDE